jgi:hypothetical protein
MSKVAAVVVVAAMVTVGLILAMEVVIQRRSTPA